MMKKEDNEKRAMSVGELIRILALFPRDKLVWIDSSPEAHIQHDWQRPAVCTKKDSNDLYLEPFTQTWPMEATELDDDSDG